MRKTAAWPLSQAYAALIAYASLYPFAGWRNQGIEPWAFLWSPWPRYWTAFDFVANVAGYMPLGFLVALAFMRRARSRSAPTSRWRAIGIAAVSAGALSFVMEATQTYLPARVPSNVDLALNLLGGVLGALFAAALEWAGAVDRWSRMREQWFVDESRGAFALVVLWPFALLFPAPVPFGLGHVLERLEAALGDWLSDTPFLEWLPVRDVELQPLVPGVELICVALGLWVPCLLSYSVLRGAGRRAFCAFLLMGAGVAATALSAALSWGPVHAWAWLSLPVKVGAAAGVLATFACLPLPRRACAAVALLALVLHLSLLNQSPASAYFTLTLQAWEQGRFIRFHGVAQWLGWVWPYAVLAYVVVRLSRSERPPRIGP